MRHSLLALSLAAPLVLAACVDAPPARPHPWKLVSMGGQSFDAPATFQLDAGGSRASGMAPCNSWSGRIVSEPFPLWAIRDVTATEMACPDLAAEQAFFAGLARSTRMAVGADHLTLSDRMGFTMEFVPLRP